MSASQDEECYLELASFLTSVAGTLEAFTFDHGFGALAVLWVGESGHHQPMDERFLKYLLPVLMETTWVSLKELNLVSVAKWRGGPVLNDLRSFHYN